MPGTIVLTESQAAYFAGLIDGEGSLFLSKHRTSGKKMSRRGFNWAPKLQVGMTDTEGIELLAKVCNKKRLRRTKPGKRSSRPCYYVTLYGGELRQVLPVVLRHLLVKRRQGELLLEAVSILGPRTDETVDARLEAISQQLTRLNHKGKKEAQ